MAYPNVLMIDDGLMFKVMHKAGMLNALCCVHAENGSVIDVVVARMIAEGKTAPHYHAHSRSANAEAEATHRAIAIARHGRTPPSTSCISPTRTRCASSSMRRQRGLQALAETCPQYLVLSLEEHMPGKSWDEAKYVFTPPLREKHNQAPLWKALEDGTLSVVSTDHCPFRFADQKSLGKDDFTKIPNGGPGIENRLQILWQFGVNSGQLTPERFVELCCTAPARIFGMPQKGALAPGKDADILLWDPNADLHHHRRDPAHGNRLLHVRRLESFGQREARLLSRRAGGQRRAVDRARPGADASSSAKPTPGASPDGHARCRTSDPHLYNADLAPTTAANRTWGTYNYIALWFSMSMEVTTYMLASSLIAGGMNWKQAIFTILLGNLIVLVPMLLNAHAGRQVRHSLPGFCARQLRHAGREYSCDAARPGGLRMVRHSVLAGRPGDRCHDRTWSGRRRHTCRLSYGRAFSASGC